MTRVIDWFARNSVAANLLMAFIVVSGAISAFSIKKEVFPEFSLDMITIQVPYLGAAPEEVRGGGQHPHRGSDPGYRRHQADHLDRVGGVRLGDDRVGAGSRRSQGRRRHQEQRRRHHDVPGRNRKAGHPRAHVAAARDRHRRLGPGRRSDAEDDRRAGAGRPVGDAGHHAGRHRQCAAIRDCHRGIRGGAAPSRTDVRPGRRRRPAVVPRPAGRVGAHGWRRDPAAHDRPGVSWARVRRPHRLDPRRWHPAASP